MDTNTYINIVHFFFLILTIVPVVIYTQGPCPVHVLMTRRCSPDQRCAMVRHGHGPPVPDCLNTAEALMLQRALSGGATGPGTGIGESRHYPVYPPRQWGRPRVVHHPSPGELGVAGANHGVPGVIPLLGGGHIHVPAPQSVRDESERINLNLTIRNNNVNEHIQTNTGNSQVKQVSVSNCSPCGPNGECPGTQYCLYNSGCQNNMACQTI